MREIKSVYGCEFRPVPPNPFFVSLFSVAVIYVVIALIAVGALMLAGYMDWGPL